ncbi:hypothetical protein EV673_1785 [Limnobacter thiooxidans]|uniref:Uncharacterized protein n=1 Tax=Limnobacter thiooxidans TaxID=131080 RepID=A0AA86J0X0_9BURK|nr:hypothetical protein [Limnobacter sp.]MCZ8016138.1 hypothetical protein [Limnobacter sp.]RZS40028.1 hypothetical protein EV673_1785 [Limnobacter thiooxidans]BET27544.1 hypothetical protein RGQ30_30450 [Limnobacter thiooxidans]
MSAPVGGSGGGDAAGQALLDIAIQELALVLIRNPQEEQLEKQRKEERDRLEGKN